MARRKRRTNYGYGALPIVPLVGGGVVLVAAVGGFLWWKNRKPETIQEIVNNTRVATGNPQATTFMSGAEATAVANSTKDSIAAALAAGQLSPSDAAAAMAQAERVAAAGASQMGAANGVSLRENGEPLVHAGNATTVVLNNNPLMKGAGLTGGFK